MYKKNELKIKIDKKKVKRIERNDVEIIKKKDQNREN